MQSGKQVKKIHWFLLANEQIYISDIVWSYKLSTKKVNAGVVVKEW